MNQHTPGPWIVDEVNTPNGVGYFVNRLWNDDEGETHTDEIAEVVMDYKGDVSLNNSRLLAAAPELYSACMAAMRAFCDDPQPSALSIAAAAACRDVLAVVDGRPRPSTEFRKWRELNREEQRQVCAEHPRPDGGFEKHKWRSRGAMSWDRDGSVPNGR